MMRIRAIIEIVLDHREQQIARGDRGLPVVLPCETRDLVLILANGSGDLPETEVDRDPLGGR